jgi:hypothetical protein
MGDSITGVSDVELNTTDWETENISPHPKFNALNEVFSIHTIVSSMEKQNTSSKSSASSMEKQNTPSKSSAPLSASTPKHNDLKDTVIQTSKNSNGIQCKNVISVL